MSNLKQDGTGKALVDPNYNYIPIGPGAPFGATVILCRKDAGRATVGELKHSETFYDHYAPCPTFKK